jgi:hypothetical protein
MRLEGSLEHNLRCAIRSSDRLRHCRVYNDTLEFWRELAQHARSDAAHRCLQDAARVNQLVRALEENLSLHDSQGRIS